LRSDVTIGDDVAPPQQAAIQQEGEDLRPAGGVCNAGHRAAVALVEDDAQPGGPVSRRRTWSSRGTMVSYTACRPS
jgi:hypothetical protein